MTPEDYRLLAKLWDARSKAAPEHMKGPYAAVVRELFALAAQLEGTGLVRPRSEQKMIS